MSKFARICILSSGSQQKLIDAAEGLGHNAFVINPNECSIDLDPRSGQNKLYHNGERIYKKNIDVVLCRGGLKGFGNNVLKMIELMDIPTTASPMAIELAADQMKTMFKLAHNNIPHIRTNLINTNSPNVEERFFEAIKRVGGYPFILKELVSSQGKGVFKIETEEGAGWAINSYKNRGVKIMLQEYIKTREKGAIGLRVWVVDGIVVAAMKKISKKDFRDNASQGAEVKSVNLTKRQKQLAIESAKAVGLEIAAIDLMYDIEKGEDYVIEANSNGGLKYISKIEYDLPRLLIEYALSKIGVSHKIETKNYYTNQGYYNIKARQYYNHYFTPKTLHIEQDDIFKDSKSMFDFEDNAGD